MLYIYYMLMMTSFIISIVNYKNHKAVQALFVLLLASVCTEIIVEFCKYYKITYYVIYHFFTPIEFALICLFFYRSSYQKLLRYFIILLSIVFTTICLISIWSDYKLEEFPRFIGYLECFFVIIISVLHLFILSPDSDVSVYRLPDFWISFAFLIFNSGLFIILFFDQSKNPQLKQVFIFINHLFNCLLYALLTIGLLCYKKKK